MDSKMMDRQIDDCLGSSLLTGQIAHILSFNHYYLAGIRSLGTVITVILLILEPVVIYYMSFPF